MNLFKTLVYPTGKYHPKYLQYIGWSFASNCLVSTQSVLSVHSMLSAVDTGGSDAVRTANYVGKDIIGQTGGLWYMSKMGKHSDKNPKKFLFYSNIVQQASYVVTCCTPLCPSYFLAIAGTANIMTNISFTGFGAINARCIQRLAVDDNIGEIYAKISVINTLGSSIGMIVGLGITTAVPDHTLRLCLVPLIGVVRVYCYNKAVEGLIS